MDYKKLMGYGDKKKIIKKVSKPKVNKVLEAVKKDLNEWNDDTFKTLPKRWSGASDKGLTEYETLKEGPAYEYKKKHKNVEKSLKNLSKDYLDFYETLRKKGLDKEASAFLDNYKKNIVDFTKTYKKLFGKLL